jgi:hypothetical protein
MGNCYVCFFKPCQFALRLGPTSSQKLTHWIWVTVYIKGIASILVKVALIQIVPQQRVF